MTKRPTNIKNKIKSKIPDKRGCAQRIPEFLICVTVKTNNFINFFWSYGRLLAEQEKSTLSSVFAAEFLDMYPEFWDVI